MVGSSKKKSIYSTRIQVSNRDYAKTLNSTPWRETNTLDRKYLKRTL